MANLNSIANRLTPSVPIEITYAGQPVATGRKFTTLFGHMTSSPGSGTPYQVYTVVNVGDPDAALAEVDALAGSGSQIGKMAAAFVKAVSQSPGAANFNAFRVVLIPSTELSFGPSDQAITAVKYLRSDMFVSCYPAASSTQRGKLLALCQLMSGVDRDLQGQFGSFMTVGSIESLATQVAYAFNSLYIQVASLPDSNTDSVPVTATTTTDSNVLTAVARAALTPTGDTASGSAVISNVSSVAGIYPGAAITGAGIPANSTVELVGTNSLTISQNATATATGVTLTITNQATAGIYEGATLTGTGIPAGTVVESVARTTLTMSKVATATGSSIAVTVQNVVSQAPEIVAAAHAGRQMSSAFPYNPLQGVTIGGLIAPRKITDRIEINPNGASEQALAAGLSPLYVQPGNTVGYIRTRTTLNLKPDNVTAVTAYFDWQEIVTLYDFRESCYQISQNPPFNNNPGGTKASAAIAALFKDEVLREAQAFEDGGGFQGVKTLAPLFVVAPSTTSRGRFDFKIPVNVLPGLMVIAGNIEAQSVLGNFTL